MNSSKRTGRLRAAIDPLFSDPRVVLSVRAKHLGETLDACRVVTIRFLAAKNEVASVSLSPSFHTPRLGGNGPAQYAAVEVNWSAWGARSPAVANAFATALTAAANVASTLQQILDEEQTP